MCVTLGPADETAAHKGLEDLEALRRPVGKRKAVALSEASDRPDGELNLRPGDGRTIQPGRYLLVVEEPLYLVAGRREPAQSLSPGKHVAGAPIQISAAARLAHGQPDAPLSLKEPGDFPTLTQNEAAARLGLTKQAITEARKAGRLLAVPSGTRSWAFPVFQFRNGALLPGLLPLLRAMGGRDGWEQIRRLLAAERRPERRPLALLEAGQHTAALAALLANDPFPRRSDEASAAIPASLEGDLGAG